ncbi:uncharacterized protein LOC123675539 [Harmonia axyridis]|uniref:uncharacterized protein LOC123675539 n=1 Tax=Harmonia axyridis TaxID=115357 RepID=UPI001E2758F1|nr:uncharacterized protein LOC123675539 [Harmonia axyridis]
MIYFHIPTLFVVVVTICNCYGDKKEGPEKGKLNFTECLDANGMTLEKYSALKKEYINPQKIGDAPKELFCVMKCIDEKYEYLKDGKVVMSKYKKHITTINFLKTPEEYLKCLEQIDVKECEDYKKKFKCDFDVGSSYLKECSSKLKLNNDNSTQAAGGRTSRNRFRKGFCLLKCGLEDKGVINNDGKILISEAAKDMVITSDVKDKDSFFNCLKGLEIKECEDIAKIWTCKKKQS